jgi:hypothetical protein
VNEKPSIFIPREAAFILQLDRRARSESTGCTRNLSRSNSPVSGPCCLAAALSLLEPKAYDVVDGVTDGVRA